MKTIILAGGMGTRLGSYTDTIPKPMVEIGNKPILWHIMKIYSYFGYKDFILCLGYKADVIKDYFYHYNTKINDFSINLSNREIKFFNKNEEDWTVTLVDTGLHSLKGARIKRVEKYLDSDINMLTYGDGVADINIKKLVEFHKSHSKTLTITGVHAPARFGELIEKDGKILFFKEKPQSSGGLINGGFMVFNNNFLDYLTPDDNCDLEIGPLEKLSSEEEVMVYKHEKNWECMDHERDVNYLNELWKHNKAFWKLWK